MTSYTFRQIRTGQEFTILSSKGPESALHALTRFPLAFVLVATA